MTAAITSCTAQQPTPTTRTHIQSRTNTLESHTTASITRQPLPPPYAVRHCSDAAAHSPLSLSSTSAAPLAPHTVAHTPAANMSGMDTSANIGEGDNDKSRTTPAHGTDGRRCDARVCAWPLLSAGVMACARKPIRRSHGGSLCPSLARIPLYFAPLVAGDPRIVNTTAASSSYTPATIPCCECGALIQANPANTCVNCLKSKVDITDGITKQVRKRKTRRMRLLTRTSPHSPRSARCLRSFRRPAPPRPPSTSPSHTY